MQNHTEKNVIEITTMSLPMSNFLSQKKKTAYVVHLICKY